MSAKEFFDIVVPVASDEFLRNVFSPKMTGFHKIDTQKVVDLFKKIYKENEEIYTFEFMFARDDYQSKAFKKVAIAHSYLIGEPSTLIKELIEKSDYSSFSTKDELYQMFKDFKKTKMFFKKIDEKIKNDLLRQNFYITDLNNLDDNIIKKLPDIRINGYQKEKHGLKYLKPALKEKVLFTEEAVKYYDYFLSPYNLNRTFNLSDYSDGDRRALLYKLASKIVIDDLDKHNIKHEVSWITPIGLNRDSIEDLKQLFKWETDKEKIEEVYLSILPEHLKIKDEERLIKIKACNSSVQSTNKQSLKRHNPL